MAGTITQGTSELWLGNDRDPDAASADSDVVAMDMGGNVLMQIVDTPTTGVAFDGTNLWFSGSTGVLTKRTKATPGVVDDTFKTAVFGNNTEDLAWDRTRGCLWRIENSPATLVKIDPDPANIDPATGFLSASAFPLAPADLDPNLQGGYGIAYDEARDRLYVSFGHLDPDPLDAGVVLTVDPTTGAVTGVLFHTVGHATGGLGYDSATDTLWVGDSAFIRHLTLAGGILAVVTRPPRGAFVDGLEFIGGT